MNANYVVGVEKIVVDRAPFGQEATRLLFSIFLLLISLPPTTGVDTTHDTGAIIPMQHETAYRCFI